MKYETRYTDGDAYKEVIAIDDDGTEYQQGIICMVPLPPTDLDDLDMSW
jgi:hypothetical protein